MCVSERPDHAARLVASGSDFDEASCAHRAGAGRFYRGLSVRLADASDRDRVVGQFEQVRCDDAAFP